MSPSRFLANSQQCIPKSTRRTQLHPMTNSGPSTRLTVSIHKQSWLQSELVQLRLSPVRVISELHPSSGELACSRVAACSKPSQRFCAEVTSKVLFCDLKRQDMTVRVLGRVGTTSTVVAPSLSCLRAPFIALSDWHVPRCVCASTSGKAKATQSLETGTGSVLTLGFTRTASCVCF